MDNLPGIAPHFKSTTNTLWPLRMRTFAHATQNDEDARAHCNVDGCFFLECSKVLSGLTFPPLIPNYALAIIKQVHKYLFIVTPFKAPATQSCQSNHYHHLLDSAGSLGLHSCFHSPCSLCVCLATVIIQLAVFISLLLLAASVLAQHWSCRVWGCKSKISKNKTKYKNY